MKIKVFAAFAVLAITSSFAGNTYYASPDGRADADCLSPATAGTIAAAYALASSAESAAAGDEIVLMPGEYDGSSAGGHFPLTIDKKFLTVRSSSGLPETTTVIGPGSAENLTAFNVSVQAGAPIIKGISFTNFFNTTLNKAGILNGSSKASATLENCLFLANKGNWGTVSYGILKNCKFIANRGTQNSVTRFSNCYDCYFEGNEGGYASEQGEEFFNCFYTNNPTGAVHGNAATVVSNCTFIANRSSMGAGVQLAGSIYDSNFIANNATKDGAAIYGASSAYAKVYRCQFYGNVAATGGSGTRFCNVYDSTFDSNSGIASFEGGEFFNCFYTNNSSGAINCSATAVISNCTFIANKARNGAGVRGAKAIYDCSFITNTITHDGCAVYGSSDGSTKIYNSYFYGNVAPQGGSATYNCSVYNSKLISNIGRACYLGSVFEDCYFTNNPSGAIQGTANSIVSNCLFIANRAKWGGAIHTAKAIYDCVFVTNWATGRGGAVYNGSEVYRSFFTNNHCIAGDRQGGATCLTSCFDSTFNSNISGSGGACYDGAYFINCHYTNNFSSGSAGAILASSSSIISNCYFVNNRSVSYGGATYLGSVYDSTYITNTGRYGGATYKGSVDRCYFYGNVGTSYAGGTHLTDSRNSIYIGNYSPSGGGADKGSFYNCYFRDNSSHSGGGIVVAAPAYLTNNIFINNRSTHGAAVNTGSGANIVNCIFIRNKSSESGGIIGGKYSETTWKGTFINCLMAENSASGYAAMYGRLVTGDSVFINCTIISNQCSPAGKRWAPASGVFTNTLFHGNANFDIERGELVNCLFGTVNMANVTTNNACIVLANPLFNPKKNPKHPFYPHKSSPAIDAGIIVPELLSTNIVELGGTKRIKGKTVDIGAYETLGPGTLFGVH
jgi:hypothetical protein